MDKHIIRWWLVGVLFQAFTAHAQAPPAQPLPAKWDSLRQEFTRYQEQSFQEKVFVHVDKSFYLAGEIVWFKVYDVDGYFHRPMPDGGIAYVELVGRDQKPVLRATIRLKEGAGSGSWVLPATVPTGNYLLRAYTNWMKNFSPGYYYRQMITVVNTAGGTASESGTATDADTLRTNVYDIRFFPEGGDLIQGLTSRVAFQSTDGSGNGVPCEGVILNGKDTVTHFRSSRFGRGALELTPRAGERYTALIQMAGSSLTKALPSVYPKGYTLRVDTADNDRLGVTVHSNSDNPDPSVYLFVQTHHRIKDARLGYLSNGQTVFYIDKGILDDGVSQLTLFNADRIPVCERLWFKAPQRNLQIRIAGLPAQVATRSAVNLSVETLDPSGHPTAGDLSLSVFQLDSLQQVPSENILTWLLLSSDLPGLTTSPAAELLTSLTTELSTSPAAKPSTSPTAEKMDDLMLTQGWTRFHWEDILQHKKSYFEFLPEIDGPIINGKVVDRRTGRPASGIMGYLAVPGRRFELSTAVSRADGKIRFNIDDLYGNNEMIVQTNSRTDSNYRIDINAPFSDKFASFSLPPLSLSPAYAPLLLDRSIAVQVENTYRVQDKHRVLPPSVPDTLSFYGRPDLQYKLADYTRFTTLEEVMKEYVADVHLRRQSGKFFYRVRNAPLDQFFEDDPLLLLDGVPVFDPDKLTQIDPARLEKIDILTRKFYLGPLVNDGIISCRSTDGELAGYTLDPNAIVLEYNGLQQQREFYTPVYATAADNDATRTAAGRRLPDLRNQLQWLPGLHTEKGQATPLTFYTSDRPGRYVAVIQGMTAEGWVGYTTQYFSVAPPVPQTSPSGTAMAGK